MACPIETSTAVVKPLEDVAAIQIEIDELKRTYQGQFPLDSAVLKVLPQRIERAYGEQYGTSNWSFTAKAVAFQSGTTIKYFMKYVPGELGRQQLRGEFAGMTALWKLAPEFVVKPISWGQLAGTPHDCSFLLMEFKNFHSRLIDAKTLASRVAELHRRSQAQPERLFGFPVQTFEGARLQAVSRDARWSSFFAKLLAEAYRQDTAANGTWQALDQAYHAVQEQLIPRLLGTLEEAGRKVVPTLIHGDLWEGNVGTDAATGEPWVFDCAAYYGHHETEMGIWRANRHKFSRGGYIEAYLDEFGYVGNRREEAEDRIRLYSAKTNFMYSACFPKSQPRIDILNDFRYLLNKYGISTSTESTSTAESESLCRSRVRG